jgi:hypothetical protein
MATARTAATTPVLPDRTSRTYCLASQAGMRVGAARSSSVAWHANRSSAEVPALRVAAVSAMRVQPGAAGSGSCRASPGPSAGTRLSHASFQ